MTSLHEQPVTAEGARASLLRLHRLMGRLLDAPDLNSALGEVLVASMEITGAELGNVQLVADGGEALEIVAQQGFEREFLERFHRVCIADDDTACGRCVRARRRVIVEDVRTEPSYRPYLAVAERAGYRAVQSTPLLSRDGRLLGALSTHYSKPHRPSEHDLRMLDLYAQQAVHLMERHRAEDVLRQAEARKTFLLDLNDALRTLEDPKLIREEASRVLREHLGGHRVVYWEAISENELTPAGADYASDAVRFSGSYRVSDLDASLLSEWTAGRVVVRNDPAGDPRFSEAQRTWFAEAGSGAWAGLPLVKEGRLVAVLTASFPEPHEWTEAELTLMEEVAERTWSAVERARAEQGLREAKRTAEAADQAKSRFLALMSHELRTPLSSVLGCVRLLEDEVMGTLGPEQRELVSRIRKSAAFQADMIEEILSVIRLDAGKESVRWEEVDVAVLVREVSEFFEPDAAERGLRLGVSDPGAPEAAYTDRAKLRQILMNLIGNAIKYTEHGEVTVALEAHGSEALDVHVRDTGCGIRPEDQEAVFEPFHQIDDSLTRTASGTGLGLAISRSLARLIGGDLTLRSVPEEGSTFTVHIPRRSGTNRH